MEHEHAQRGSRARVARSERRMGATDLGVQCYECEAGIQLQPYEHTETVGPCEVKDSTRQAWRCTSADCGEVLLPIRELGGYQRRAAAVVLWNAKTVNGTVIRYARKAIGLRQIDLADILGCASETLSRWETDNQPTLRDTQLALIAILYGVDACGGDAEKFLMQEKARSDFKYCKVKGIISV
jgi:DNA-binding XRE family transcriptional regulator